VALAIFISGMLNAAVVWQDPAKLAAEDTGPPAPPFHFVREEMGGTAPKIVVTDAKNVTWYVKFNFEVKPETLAAQIVRQAGYYAPVTYYVAEGKFENFPQQGLKRSGTGVDPSSGRFQVARFSREMKLVKGASWNLDEPSLRHSKELSGLKLLIAITANWDIKPPNFAVVEAGGQQMFAITDWGQTFGAPDMKSHWNCKQYSDSNKWLTHGNEDGYLYLEYGGKQSNVVTNGIKIEHAKWLLGQLRGLNQSRVTDLLRKSGATDEETTCFAPAIMKRLNTLRAALSEPPE
jgi:hypothetical protein